MTKKKNDLNSGRRNFIKIAGLGTMALGFGCSGGQKKQPEAVIPGFEKTTPERDPHEGYIPISDRKVRVGLVGYGACKFATQFSLQNHPNVEVIAVSDLFPDRCAELAKVAKCNKTYPSLEEMVKDDKIEAIFCATDAPSHARHAKLVLEHGKHVATAVPAIFGSIEEADMLMEVVKKNRGLKYMLFETSCYRGNLYAMRQLYKAGALGKIVYSEGEYFHGASLTPGGPPLGSYKNWRNSMPPQWYPTHSNAYYVGVTDGTFTEVSCMGWVRNIEKPADNQYKNPFSSEIALFRTSEGGISRMARTNTIGMISETGRVQGEKGSYYEEYVGTEKELPDLNRPALPPGVEPGGHGGSHGNLGHEFISSIIQDRNPLVDVVMALNLTVSGVVAHASALKDGELMKIPQYSW